MISKVKLLVDYVFCFLVFQTISDSHSTNYIMSIFCLLRKVSQVFGSREGNITQDKPNNSDPSCNASRSPCVPHSPLPEDIPRNILAFRTITTLLSQIQQGRALKVPQSYNAQLDREELRELKISDAFSTVAVIEHEIVAVVTNRGPETLEVIASIQSPSDDFPCIKPSNSPFSGLAYQDFQPPGITQNHRRDSPQPAIIPTRDQATITDAEVPAGLASVDDEAIKSYVEACW